MEKLFSLLLLLILTSCGTQKPLIDFGGEQEYEAMSYSSLAAYPKEKIKSMKFEKNQNITFTSDEGESLLEYSKKNWAIKKVKDIALSRLTLGVDEIKPRLNGLEAPYIVFRLVPKNGDEVLIKPQIKVEKSSSSFWSGEKYKVTFNYDFTPIKEKSGTLYLQSLAMDPPLILSVVKGATCTIMITPTMYDTRPCNLPVRSAFEVEAKILDIQ